MTKLPENIRYAVCYLRKSREDEEAEFRGEDTLLKQRELMVHEVLARYSFGYDIAEEVASGDSIRARPVFRQLLPELGFKYQAIVCKDLSRLGRGSYGDMGIVYDIIRDRRVFVITKDAVYDPRNFSDLRMIRFSLFFNREEYEMTLWRLTEGKYDGAQRGKWVAGSVPYGFCYDSHAQTLKPHESEAEVVKAIYCWFAIEGLGYNSIATRLRRMGIKTARGKDKWRPEVIRRILQNPAYKGTLVFRKTKRNKLDGKVAPRPVNEQIVVEEAFEGVVDKETWKAAQSRFARTGSNDPKVKSDYSSSELAGLITCSGCRQKMVRQYSTQRYQKKDGFISTYKKEFLYCPSCGYAIKYRDCEAQLLQVLQHISCLDQTMLEHHLRVVQAAKATVTMDITKVAEQLDERRHRAMRRMERAREFLLDGTFSREDFEAAKGKYQRELKDIEQTQNELTPLGEWEQKDRTPDTPDMKIPWNTVIPKHHDLVELYQHIEDKSVKNRLLRGLFEEITLRIVQKGSGKNHPTQFDLFVTLHPLLLSP